METHNGNGSQVFITTSFKQYKKLNTSNAYYESYGSGRRYWKYLSPRTIIGAASPYSEDLGKLSSSNVLISKLILYSDISPDTLLHHKRRINDLKIDWTFDTVDEIKELKDFLENHNTIMVEINVYNALKEFKETYGVNLKDLNTALEKNNKSESPLDYNSVYELYNDRYVLGYNIIGMSNDTNQAMLYTVKWNDYDSLKYIEEKLDDFIIISDFRVINDKEG